MAISIETLSAAKAYVEQTLKGAGALKGADGKDGMSAYQMAVDKGFEGSEEEWLESLNADMKEVKVYIDSQIGGALNGSY